MNETPIRARDGQSAGKARRAPLPVRAAAPAADTPAGTAARTAVVVLGMHRSGTSALAGVLGILGCDLPAAMMRPGPANEKGFFESGRLYRLQNALLDSAGTRWDDWLPIGAGWTASARGAEFHERALSLMHGEYGDSRLFVLKDPRICRQVPFWEGVFADMGVAPRYVLIHRNPLEVAASLEARDGLPVPVSLLVWLRHVLDAEHDSRGGLRTFTSYARLLDNWAETAHAIQDGLGLHLPRLSVGVVPEVEAFLDTGLRHHAQAAGKVLRNPLLSDWVRDAYGILERWAEAGEKRADRRRLDEIRAALDETAATFAPLVQLGRAGAEGQAGELRQRDERIRTLGADLEAAGLRLDEAQQARAALGADLEEVRDRLSQTRSALEQRSHEAEETHRALGDLREAREADLARERQAARQTLEERETLLGGQIARRSEQVSTLESTLKVQYRELADLTRILAGKEADLDRERRNADEARRGLESRLAEVEQRREDERGRHADTLAQRMQEAETALKAEKGRAERAEFAVMALQSSTSWRLTAPLRALGSAFRRGG